jgi:hypothetical protein
MKINLTKKQYESLAKAVYLGNWIANAHRTGAKNDPTMKEYEDIYDYIFSLAEEFGLPEDFEYDVEFGKNGDFDGEVSRLHEEYDAESFWDELCDRLGERDFHRKYTKEQIMKMTKDERFIKLQECVMVWEEECENHGVDRLEVLMKVGDIFSDQLFK